MNLTTFLKTKKSQIIWLLVVVPILGFLSLRHSLNLSLWGDDWLHLWIWIFHFQTKKYVLSSYLTPVGTTYLLLGIIYSFFDLNPLPYYVASLASKILAAIGVYFFARGITKSYLAGMIASAFFAVCYVGLDTTNYVFYAIVYLGIFLVGLFIFFFYESRRNRSFRQYLLAVILFILALWMAPVRMHGIFIIVLAGLLWFLRKPSLKVFGLWLLRLIPLAGAILLLHSRRILGFDYANYYIFHGGIKHFLDLLRQGRFDFLFYPVTLLGNVVFPDKIWEVPWIVLTFLFIGALTINLIYYIVHRIPLFFKRPLDWIPIAIGILWVFFIYILTQTQSRSFHGPEVIGPTLLGGLFLLWTIWLYLRHRKSQPELAEGLLFSTGWIIAFYVAGLIRTQHQLFPSVHRYMTLSSVGACVFFSCLIILMQRSRLTPATKPKRRPVIYTIYLLVALIFIINFAASNHYLKELVQIRGTEISNTIWDSFAKQFPVVRKGSVFYFESDNETIFHKNVSYGFPPRVGILHNCPTMIDRPLGTPDFEEFSSLIRGVGWERHALTPHKIDREHIYALRMEGTEIIDIKPQVMERLKKTGVFNESGK